MANLRVVLIQAEGPEAVQAALAGLADLIQGALEEPKPSPLPAATPPLGTAIREAHKKRAGGKKSTEGDRHA